MSARIIFHIDVNSAFLSWEATYGLNERGDQVDLREVPSIIGGDEKTRHGIVLAASMPAKRLGIKTAETIREALTKCPSLVIRPPMHSLYARYSKAFIKEALEYSNQIEQFSIDEVFLDMTGKISTGSDPYDVAMELKNRIYDKLGFTVNIGVAPNKLLAKMASDFEKPNRVHTLYYDEIPQKMWPLPVRELFFVGKATQKKLLLLGVKTIGDLANFDLELLKSHLGNKHATTIHNYANGFDDSLVEARDDLNKGYGNSTTLPKDVCGLEEARPILLSLCEMVASRLRADYVKSACITVEMKDCNFTRYTHQTKLDTPTDITNEIMEIVEKLFLECDRGQPIRHLGVRASNVTKEEYNQMQLFVDEKKEKLRKLDASIDTIRQKYGKDSIQRASFLNQSISHMTGKDK